MALYTVHLPQWKKDEVEETKRYASEYDLVGLVDLYGIPGSQMQDMRRNLRGKAVLKMTRNTLIRNAFSELGGDIAPINNYLDGQSALIYTNESPFKLFRMLAETMTKMLAKPGDIAPEDIVISKGPTGFPAGPIVGELQQVGIAAAIEKGKVVIRTTKTFIKAGEVINKKQADTNVRWNCQSLESCMGLCPCNGGEP